MADHFDTLADALNWCTISDLKPCLALLPIKKPKTLKKADYVSLIQTILLTPSSLKTQWTHLSEKQQQAISETVHNSFGEFDAPVFKAKYGSYPTVDTRLKLFFYENQIPDDLCEKLKKIAPKPPEDELQSHAKLPISVSHQQQREHQAIVELHTMLELIETSKISVSAKTTRPTAATIKTITAALPNHDFYAAGAGDITAQTQGVTDEIGAIKAFAWPMLLQAGKLVTLQGTRLTLTASGKKALTAPPEKTLATLWKRWLKNSLIDELQRIEVIKGQTGKGKRSLTATAPRRAAIEMGLRQMVMADWVDTQELFRYMRANSIIMHVSRDKSGHLYIGDKNYGTLAYHSNDLVDIPYFLCVLFEYAATLGLIDVAYNVPHEALDYYNDAWGMDDHDFFSRYDGLHYIRLTSLGHYILALSATYQATAETQAYLEKQQQAVKTELVRDVGTAQVYECKTAALAKKLAADPKIKKYVIVANQRYLIVDSQHVLKVKKWLATLK